MCLSADRAAVAGGLFYLGYVCKLVRAGVGEGLQLLWCELQVHGGEQALQLID